jgi:hypothetical protein
MPKRSAAILAVLWRINMLFPVVAGPEGAGRRQPYRARLVVMI